MKLTRYRNTINGMREYDSGEWVTARDAVDLQAEIERLREELAAANREIGWLEILVENLQEDLYGDESE